MREHYTPPASNSNDAEALTFAFERLLSGKFFIQLVAVVDVRGTAPDLVVDVLPLVTQTDPTGAMISNATIFNVPVFRLQRGNSAVIMDPVAGDIGMIAVCDRDNSGAKVNRKPSVPGTKRTHSKSDALYLGGFLNGQPDQYVEFADDGIKIVTPTALKVTAPGGVEFDAPWLKVTGDIIDNSSSQETTVKQLREANNTHRHPVEGVEPGSGRVTSSAGDKPL